MARKAAGFVAVLASAAFVACATVASTPQSPQVTQSERQQAAKQHSQLLAEFGGAYTGPQAAYVSRVGQKMAVAAGLPNQCTFTVVNTDVVNAFAVPGCYIYVTRGLLAIMNDEAELASVLGHEIGHVTAAHSQRRQRTAILPAIGSILAGVLTGSGELAQLAGQLGQLYTLSYSRGQEYEADDLGVGYLVKAGYDPYGAAGMLRALERNDQLEAKTRGREAHAIPEWGRTHPLTAGRIERAVGKAKQTGVARGALPAGQAAFLNAVDGMLYGDDPRQGFVIGRTFAHPELKLAFEAPQGFALANSTQVVLIEGPSGFRAQFSGGRLSGGLEDHAMRVMRQLVGQGQVQLGSARRTTVNGLETVILPARANTQTGAVDLSVAAYRFGPDTAYHFATLAPAGRDDAFTPLIRSVRRLSDSEAAALRPRVIDVVAVKPGETAATLANRMAFENYRLERFQVLNAYEAGTPLRAGERVKLVVYGRAGG